MTDYRSYKNFVYMAHDGWGFREPSHLLFHKLSDFSNDNPLTHNVSVTFLESCNLFALDLKSQKRFFTMFYKICF